MARATEGRETPLQAIRGGDENPFKRISARGGDIENSLHLQYVPWFRALDEKDHEDICSPETIRNASNLESSWRKASERNKIGMGGNARKKEPEETGRRPQFLLLVV